jgi:hypothetical protein
VRRYLWLWAIVVLLMAGCGSSGDADSASGDATAAGQPVVVSVTIADGEVEPSGERVPVKAGQPVEFDVTSDVAGELHVHSDPDHSIEIEPGTTQETVTINRPGVVEVELHDPEVVVVQLEVR